MKADNSDIVISIGADAESLKVVLASLRKRLKTSLGDKVIAKDVSGLNQHIKKLTTDMSNLSKGGLGLPTNALKGFKDANNLFKEFTKATRPLKDVNGVLKNTVKNLGSASKVGVKSFLPPNALKGFKDANNLFKEFPKVVRPLKDVNTILRETTEGLGKVSGGTKKGFLPPNALKGFKDANTHLDVLRKGAVKTRDGFGMMSKAAKGATDDMNVKLKKNKGEFQGWAMSIMFFGMAIKRVFDSAWKAGKTTFQDITHSVEGAVTGFDNLNASGKYLGYTLGAALEPIASFLAPIIWAVAEWVEANPKLSATLLIVAGVLGTILFFIGTMVLGIAGLIAAFNIVGPALTTASTAVAAFFVGITGPVWIVVGIIIAALVLIYAAWKTNFGGIQEFFFNTFDIIKTVFKSVFGNIKNIFKNFIEFFKNVFAGDWEKAWQNIVEILNNIMVIMLKMLVGLSAIIINIVIFVINIVKDTLFYLLRFMNWMVKEIVTLFIWLGGAIAKAFMSPLQNVINFINRVIRSLHRAGFAKRIKVIDVDFGSSIDNAVKVLNDGVKDFFQGSEDAIAAAQDAATLDYVSGDFVGQALKNIDEGAGTNVKNYNITVNQQPGETNEDVGMVIADEINRRTVG